jgi:hypothetical protein
MLPVAVHPGALSSGVTDGVAEGTAESKGDAGGPDGGGVATGAGPVTDVQATIRRPTTIVVATREIDERIPCPPDGVSPPIRAGCGSLFSDAAIPAQLVSSGMIGQSEKE